jgi:hypothetical protein
MRFEKRLRKQHGLVFMTTVAFVFLGLLSMMVIQRKMQTYINVLQAENRAAASEDGQHLAMAQALSVLQTGLPPGSPVTYNLQLNALSGTPVFTVLYEEITGTPTCSVVEPNWKVTVEPGNGANPALPDHF